MAYLIVYLLALLFIAICPQPTDNTTRRSSSRLLQSKTALHTNQHIPRYAIPMPLFSTMVPVGPLLIYNESFAFEQQLVSRPLLCGILRGIIHSFRLNDPRAKRCVPETPLPLPYSGGLESP